MILVELILRYSKTPYPPIPDIPVLTPRPRRTPRVHAVRRRLQPDVIDQLVADYQAGIDTTELTTRYRLGKGTVLKLLREAGVIMRRQGLSPAEIDEAVELYAAGWSLARIGERFGRAHTVIRKALLDRGIAMHPGTANYLWGAAAGRHECH
ncbi:MAG TPA: helix-turn-helix domain-containing protein [Candidatus Saccharimonadales bacterium]|nr:helix-turn-helix domain-containing protein [Candidatus Saccharimonadales bacterium]